jgi:hypothetical protein
MCDLQRPARAQLRARLRTETPKRRDVAAQNKKKDAPRGVLRQMKMSTICRLY